MKKLMAFLLALTIIITAMPLAIADEKVRTSGEFEYTLKGNGTATIVGCHGDSDEDIIIPNMLDGYVVTTIGEKAFLNDRAVDRSATLPESITTIEDKAFWNSGVTSVNIPNSVTYIGYGAFSCNSRSVVFRISPNHPAYAVIDSVLYNKRKKEALYIPNNGTVSIPEGIVSIGDYAHHGKNLGELRITFPSTLKSIGNYAFASAEESDKHFLYATNESIFLESIGDYAFYNALIYSKRDGQRLKIGATTIGRSAFEGGISVILMEGTEKIGDYAFKATQINMTIPASVKEVGAYSFHCTFNGSLDFAENSQLTTIGEGAFSLSANSKDFYDVHLPEVSQIRSIEAHAFENAWLYNVESTLNNVETIGEYAFYDAHIQKDEGIYYHDAVFISAICKTIPSHTFVTTKFWGQFYKLQDGVEIIESQAFNKVNDFYLPETLTDIAIDAFGQGSTFVVEQGSYAERWAEENAYPYSINGQEQNLDWLLN